MMPLGHMGIPLIPFLMKRDMDWDMRILVIGSILPDIIDKPLGHLIMPENNGRIFAHTLLFSTLLLIVALRYRPLLPLSLGVSLHQIFDGMFLDPRGSLWPLLGGFEHTNFHMVSWVYAFTEPFTIAEEVFGLIMIILFIRRYGLLRPDAVKEILRTGRVHSRRI